MVKSSLKDLLSHSLHTVWMGLSISLIGLFLFIIFASAQSAINARVLPENGKILEITDFEIENVTETQASFSWTTNYPATTKVEYGLYLDKTEVVQEDEKVTEHSLTLNNLLKGSRYYVTIISESDDDLLSVGPHVVLTKGRRTLDEQSTNKREMSPEEWQEIQYEKERRKEIVERNREVKQNIGDEVLQISVLVLILFGIYVYIRKRKKTKNIRQKTRRKVRRK